MATQDTSNNMLGTGSNPGLLLRAVDYKCDGTDVVYSSAYLDGKAIKGTYEGQKLMETHWFTNGVLNNIVLPTLYIEAKTAATQNLVDSLKITVFKRDMDGNDIGSTDLYVIYQTKVSNNIGQMPVNMWVNRQATEFPWFDIRYQYKMVISVNNLTAGQELYLEGMYLQYVQNTSVMIPQQELYGSNNIQSIPIIEGLSWNVDTTGGSFTAQFPSDYFGTAGVQRSLLNSIDAAVTSLAGVYDDNTDSFTWCPTADQTFMIQTSFRIDSGGGYTIYVKGDGFPGGTFYFNTIVIGYITPRMM